MSAIKNLITLSDLKKYLIRIYHINAIRFKMFPSC